MGHIVDISKWNDNINWDIAAPQLDLAICRVQYGSRKVDEWYQRYVAKLEEYGIPHAAYAYGCYISVKDAIVEADDFMSRTSPNAKFLVLDVEDDTLQSCGANNLASASQAFIDRCKSRGWKVGLYLSHHMYSQYGLNSVKADFLWIPRYGGKKPAYTCDIWQYTETGHVEGIGKCDLNYLVGNKGLEWFIGVEQTIATSQYDSSWFTKQNGVFTSNTSIKVRREPSVNAEHVRTLQANSTFTYESFGYEKEGYVWLKGVDGLYVASGETVNGKRVSHWGSFK